MPHANGDETLGELADRMIRECAMWREWAMRLEMTAEEREALLWFTGGRGPVCPRNLAIIRGLIDRHS